MWGHQGLRNSEKEVFFSDQHQGVSDHQLNLKTDWKETSYKTHTHTQNSDFGSAETCFASRLKAVFRKLMRMLGNTAFLPCGSVVKNLPHAGDVGLIPGLWRSLEKGMIPHSSILAWEIPWTEEPGVLQSMGSQRVGHGWATNTYWIWGIFW